MPIQKLSKLLVNQIAAGEVIERPASVVKELVENSIDAGASRIDVLVEEGGRERIRIADDGGGIDASELHLAVEAHATSKIQTVEDLNAIHTMGFRGEALASIASISRMQLTSRRHDVDAGATLHATSDEVSEVQPIGCAPGTIIEVRNLFYNTPARRKFMRTASTEFSHISNIVSRIALAQAHIGFKLTHNQRVNIDLPPEQTRLQRAVGVLGEGLREALLEFESQGRGIKLWGLAGLPSIAKATARHQYVYINGRPIHDRRIMHAMKEAYRGLIEPNQQPMIVLFIEMDPTLVDVNVHPTKHEVRFADPNPVHGEVLAAIRQRLLSSDLTPKVQLKDKQPGFNFSFNDATASSNADSNDPDNPDGVGGAGRVPSSPEITTQFVDYFKRMDPSQKGFVYQQVKQEMAPFEDSREEQDRPLQSAMPTRQTSMLQVHNSYIITQDEDGIMIIDQHALHERVMFQTLIERIEKQGQLESQRLLTPVAVDLTLTQMDMLDRLEPLFQKLGIEVSPLGPTTIGIHAFPTLLFDRGVDPLEFLPPLVERAEDEDFEPGAEEALHEVLDMMSCKAAIKAGDKIQQDEIDSLLQRRNEIERASNCPHGRPTTIRLTLSELEKQFKRT